MTKEIKLNKSIIRAAVKDTSQSAKAVNLIYVSGHHLSIERAGKAKNFYYLNGKVKINDENNLVRIKKLAIPPAWRNVRICKLANGHLQATGFDVLNRKQYRYHNHWSVIRNHTKFSRLFEFGKLLPSIRIKLQKDLSSEGYPREKVLAAVVSLLELTNIRVGNDSYEKLYGSFGLTTLKNRHVSLSGSKLVFTFKGKKGIKHNISLCSKKLARIVKGCKDIPGKDLFGYLDENGIAHDVDSGMVNEYIRNISGGDFTAKDFRTWTGSVEALIAFKEIGGFGSENEMKQKINEAFEIVSRHLGNTKAVCKKYYVHPVIIKLYEEKKLDQYIGSMTISESDDNKFRLTPEERVLMKVLEHSYIPVV